MDFKFYLNDIEIEEPVGFADIVFNVKRDENWHGVFHEASTSDLGFYGEAAQILEDAKENYGIEANVEFKATYRCDNGEYADAIIGKLDFGQWVSSCGNECIITMPVEAQGCIMTLRNRYDQKVDVDSQLAFDKLTVLENYAGINFPLTLPAKDLEARVEGYVTDDSYSDNYGNLSPNDARILIYRPTYADERYNSISTGQLQGNNLGFGFVDGTDATFPNIITPQLLFEDLPQCYSELEMTFRLKGTFTAHSDDDDYQLVFGGIFAKKTSSSDSNLPYYAGLGCDPSGNDGEIQDFETVYCDASDNPTDISVPFDITFTITETPSEGDAYFAYMSMFVARADELPENFSFSITFDPETSVLITGNKSCPPTEANVSLIHETLSRVTEAITDRCLTVKSDYYGRVDSQPYAAAEDGCGSLRVLTSGLKIRDAVEPKYFQSLRDLFDGLTAIDNIGMGIEATELRVEPVEYFYQDSEILKFDHLPLARFILDEKYYTSIIKIGYKKWEVERVNGLDEINSNKEFRTSLTQVNNILDKQSGFVAGSYAIEVARQQGFATSGGADTTYDNDTFIICVRRGGYSGYEVEQGNVTNAANFYSPQTVYNWRIRPMYNLMRWFKSVANSYVNLINSASKLYFSAGTGNLTAEGELVGDCKEETVVKAENDDLFSTDLVDNVPIWKPERVEFTYPLSIEEYQTIKSNPYGYITIECNGFEYKGFIRSINYRPSRGSADFNLLLKWS